MRTVERVLVAEFTIDGVEYEAELRARSPATVEIGIVSRKVRDESGELMSYEWRTIASGEWCSRRRAIEVKKTPGDGMIDKRLVDEAERGLRKRLGDGAN